MAQHRNAPPTTDRRGAKVEHWQALGTDYITPPRRRELDELAGDSYPRPEPLDPEAEREALLRRVSDNAGGRAAFALLALHGQSPRLADPIIEYISRREDLIDELLLCNGDSAAHDAQRREREAA